MKNRRFCFSLLLLFFLKSCSANSDIQNEESLLIKALNITAQKSKIGEEYSTPPWWPTTERPLPTTGEPWWPTTERPLSTTGGPWWPTTDQPLSTSGEPWWPTSTEGPWSTTHAPTNCPVGWLDTPYGCFLFDYSSCILGCSWFEAFQLCKDKGGHLVEVNFSEKWDLLSSQLYLLSSITHTEDYKWWTGGYYNPSNYYYSWFYSGQAISFSDWARYEPSYLRDESIYLSVENSGGTHRWFSGPSDVRNGHPLCEIE